jgi:MerR family transcriptional regulator, light-induced transcriptional regulator
MAVSEPIDSGYGIGAVSRLSGVPRETIRIWERRYDAVQPARDASNRRQYSRDDIDRLILLRRLVDQGHAISSVARLGLADLQTRLVDAAPTTAAGSTPGTVLAITADPTLPARLAALGATEVNRADDRPTALAWLADHAADLIVLDQPTLLGQDVAGIVAVHRRAPRTPMLVTYRFAARPLIDQLEGLGIRTSKAPLEPHDLQDHAPALEPAEPRRLPETLPARRYAADALQRLATLSGNVQCECPRHLADLVRDLQAFEDYSLGCQNASPADAALHREVHRVIANARALVEDALGIVAAEEQLEP